MSQHLQGKHTSITWEHNKAKKWREAAQLLDLRRFRAQSSG